MALVPLPAGLGVPKRRLECLERLKHGKQQLERQQKAIDVALVPLPAWLVVLKRRLEGLEGLEGLTPGKWKA